MCKCVVKVRNCINVSNATTYNLIVASNCCLKNCKNVGSVNFSYLCVTNCTIACVVKGVSLLICNLYVVLTKSCVPVVFTIAGPLSCKYVLVEIVNNVLTYVTLTVSVFVCVCAYLCAWDNTSTVSGVPVVCTVSCPILCVSMLVIVLKFTYVTDSILVVINVIKLPYGYVITVTCCIIPVSACVLGPIGICFECMNMGLLSLITWVNRIS